MFLAPAAKVYFSTSFPSKGWNKHICVYKMALTNTPEFPKIFSDILMFVANDVIAQVYNATCMYFFANRQQVGLKIGECQALKCQDFLTLWYGQGSHRNIFALAVFSILPKINYEVVTIINCRAKPVGPRFPRTSPSTF